MQRVYEENEWGKVSKRIVTVIRLAKIVMIITYWAPVHPCCGMIIIVAVVVVVVVQLVAVVCCC